jgi:hypothetical protein
MDELTMERYPHGVPYAETHARPRRRPAPSRVEIPVDSDEISRRRAVLIGPGRHIPAETRWARERRLVKAIRTWVV